MNDLDDDSEDESSDETPWWVDRGYELERIPTSNQVGMYGPVATAVDEVWTWGLSQQFMRQRCTFTGRWRNET